MCDVLNGVLMLRCNGVDFLVRLNIDIEVRNNYDNDYIVGWFVIEKLKVCGLF